MPNCSTSLAVSIESAADGRSPASNNAKLSSAFRNRIRGCVSKLTISMDDFGARVPCGIGVPAHRSEAALPISRDSLGFGVLAAWAAQSRTFVGAHSLSSIEVQPRSVTGSRGIVLRGDSSGDPSHPPVLLLHGGGQTRHAWSGTARQLAGAGWNAISVDLRGHGESDWSPEGDYRHGDFAADTTAIARSFDTPPVLVGASLGGVSSLLALGEAKEQPLASALVLVDIATRMELRGAARIISFMKDKPEGFESLKEAAAAVARYNPHRPRPSDLSGLNKNLRRGKDGRYRWHWDPQFLEGPKNPTDGGNFDPESLDRAARSLTLPTLLVRGKMSDLLSEEGAREFSELVPHAKFVDVSGAGHMVAGDRNDLFASAVVSFLEAEVRSQ